MAEVRDELAANVVHVAAAKSSSRVDATAHPISPGSSECDVSSLVPRNASMVNCDADSPGRCLPDSSVVGKPTVVSPQRSDVIPRRFGETKMNGDSRTLGPTKHASDVSPNHRDSCEDAITDDMVTFRAALDAIDPSAMVGLRRARSKSVLVPVCRPPPAAVRFRSRGSVHCDQLTHDVDDVDVDVEQPQQHYQRLFQQHQQLTTRAVRTSVTNTVERYRSSSLATQRSQRSRDSMSMSEMCLEYMRLNGIIPRYPSLQHHDNGCTRSIECRSSARRLASQGAFTHRTALVGTGHRTASSDIRCEAKKIAPLFVLQ